jgi:hypothetical protein
MTGYEFEPEACDVVCQDGTQTGTATLQELSWNDRSHPV